MRALRALRCSLRTDTLDVSVKRALELENLDPRLQNVLRAVLQSPEKVEEFFKPEVRQVVSIPPPPPKVTNLGACPSSGSTERKVKKGNGAASQPSKRETTPKFPPWWTQVEIENGLKSGEAFEGVLRVSAFHTDRAFVQRSDGTSVRVSGFIGRNRAMNGDTVVAQFYKPDSKAKDTKGDTSQADADTQVLDAEVTAKADKAQQDRQFSEVKQKTIEATISILRERPDRKMRIALLGSCPAIKEAKQPGRGSLVALLEKCPEIELAVIDEQLHAILNEPEPAPLPVPVEESSSCKIVAISERIRKGIVGQIKGDTVQPRDSRLPAFETQASSLPMNENDLVVVTYDSWPVNKFSPKGRIVEVLGPQGDAMTEADAIASWYEFVPQEHSPKMEAEALMPRKDELKRKDLRSLRVFTVDPPHAKDLDDALSVEALPNGRVRVGVHIADVSHYVRPNGLIDAEARRRLVTLYLVNKVYPMLPRCLSDNMCSLLPNEDRNAFSVFYIINSKGALSDDGREFTKSIIHSNRRWSYKEVDDALASGENNDATIEDLRLLQKVTQKRKEKRLSSGGVALSSRAELRFELDESGSPTGIVQTPKEESPSHTLIEELMVLCNHVVAKELLRGTGGLLRSHTEAENGPSIILNILGDDQPPADVPRTSRGLLDWVEANKPEAYEAICFATLQGAGFKPAEYKVLKKKERHWALNLPSYLHFTSPIRRYADVVVHRMLVNQLLGRKEKEPKEKLTQIAELCNKMKKNAFDASNDSTSWHFGEYLRLYCRDGLKADVVITKVIEPKDADKKAAMEVYVPLVGQMKSVALEHLNMTLEEAQKLPLLAPRHALIVPSTDKSRNWTIRGLT